MLTESDRTFFRPKSRRIIATLVCIVWAILEWTSGETLWGSLAIGLTIYCIWAFFYKYNKEATTKK